MMRYMMNDDIRIVVDPVFLAHIYRYQWAMEILKDRKPLYRILDAGCGSGYGTFMLSSLVEDGCVHGIDNNPQVIAWAKSTYGFSSPRTYYRQGSVQEIVSDDNFYDAVVCFEVLEHLEDPGQALAEFKRVLKPDGIFIGSIPINHPDTKYHKKQYSLSEAERVVMSLPVREGATVRYQHKNSPIVTGVANLKILDTIVFACELL